MHTNEGSAEQVAVTVEDAVEAGAPSDGGTSADAAAESAVETLPALRLVAAVGLNPGKWARIWAERYPEEPVAVSPASDAAVVDAVRSGAADLALVREPFDRGGLHAIELFAETPVVVLPREHAFADEAELAVADLADEQVLLEPRVLGWRERAADAGIAPEAVWLADEEEAAIGMVPSTEGVVVTPLSVARLFDRKDVRHVVIADLPRIPVFLVWSRDLEASLASSTEAEADHAEADDAAEAVGAPSEPPAADDGRPTPDAAGADANALEERIQRFVGVVRGRRAASSRDADGGADSAVADGERSAGRAGGTRSKRAPASAGSRTKSGTSRGAQLRAKQAADEAKARAKREERAAKRRKRR